MSLANLCTSDTYKLEDDVYHEVRSNVNYNDASVELFLLGKTDIALSVLVNLLW